ncbi:GNAT family N-acetyltransferase [Paludibacterium paludis]|uniref:N-acetyltransferase n=1 Tax=Paludibacterium paludis TaxID=1225769 RepID=A0A918U936_9NEIS|nr:GNAT family N-acetyltransferase [Paludibacterium paludis]GGY12361.1 N-acetyltransferase [Paludibacterium paludis]
MNVSIRRLDRTDSGDLALLVALTDAYARDAAGGGNGLSAHARAHLGQAFAAHPSTFALVAEEGGEALGHALCFLGFSSFYAAPTAMLHDLSVLPAARGRGIGRLLMLAVEEEGRRRGCAKAMLEVRDDNTVARKLYETSGYEVSGLGGSLYRMMEKVL